MVLVPARMSRSEEAEWVRAMVARVGATEARRPRRDSDLQRRATDLSRQYLAGRAQPTSVRWVPNQRTRWGSCTPAEGTIRLSAQLRDMPGWVRDYVLLHELAHLLEPGHGPRFWALLAGYPKLERARGYLQGVAATAGLDIADDVPDLDADAEVDAADVEATPKAGSPPAGDRPTFSDRASGRPRPTA